MQSQLDHNYKSLGFGHCPLWILARAMFPVNRFNRLN